MRALRRCARCHREVVEGRYSNCPNCGGALGMITEALTARCPKCQSARVSSDEGMNRCEACGHTWSSKRAPGTMPKGSKSKESVREDAGRKRCPKCGSTNTGYITKGRKYKCGNCGHEFSASA